MTYLAVPALKLPRAGKTFGTAFRSYLSALIFITKAIAFKYSLFATISPMKPLV